MAVEPNSRVVARRANSDVARRDDDDAGALAHILATGDLAKLSNEQRVSHYLSLCTSLGLNPVSRPFDWLMLDGRLVLYPNKSCAEQLRRQHQISVKITRREVVGDLFVCEVEGRTPTGRTDESSKYVPLTGPRGRLVGKDLANAFAKAETGAKRRLVLSMVGLASPPDPDEVKSARFVVVDGAGNVIDRPNDVQRALAADPGMARIAGEPTYETTGNADAAPLAGYPNQRVKSDELVPPSAPDGPRPTFGCDQDAWLSKWQAVVAGSSLATPAGEARFITAYTSGWRVNLRASSVAVLLARLTDRQAEELIAAADAEVRAEYDAGDDEYPNLTAQLASAEDDSDA